MHLSRQSAFGKNGELAFLSLRPLNRIVRPHDTYEFQESRHDKTNNCASILPGCLGRQ